MSRSAAVLLIAGPCELHAHQDPSTGAMRWWQGAGFYAAASAAPLVHTQLWSAFPADTREDEIAILERRRIDTAGCETLAGVHALPEVEPIEAEDLGACLIASLTGDDHARARKVIAALPDAERRPLVVTVDPSDTSFRLSDANGVTVLILGLGQACTVTDCNDPVDALDALIAAGATCVLLTGGPLGGLAGYKAKRCTWPVMPQQADHSGRARAVFAGVVASTVAQLGRIDWRNLKRALAQASAVASESIRKPGPKCLMQLDGAAYQRAFLGLRRNHKF